MVQEQSSNEPSGPTAALSPQRATVTPGNQLSADNSDSDVRASSLRFLGHKMRRLKLASSRSSGSSQTPVDVKGAFGLNVLHEPSEPRVDFVFVHGLGGGSRKTWGTPSQPGTFWPKEWLPLESGFEHVRIHSYGYHSDWTTRSDSRLTVHDFGQALLADLHNSPELRKNSNTPIVLVTHSMGGLVAKKAYLLATRDPLYQAIARRIHTIYFFGTPHRGADSARLAKLLRHSAGYGSKAFLADLIPGSGTLDQINDEFRHVCEDLQLWSFSESVPTSFGLTSSLIVDKASAVIGLPKEHSQYIAADHRHICKFDTKASPNYIIVKRAFATTLEDIETRSALVNASGASLEVSHMASIPQQDDYKLQTEKVASFLRIDQDPDATLLAMNEKQHPGSCEWLTEDDGFQRWMGTSVHGDDGRPTSSKLAGHHQPSILWLNGRPGTGKSVAAGHVIHYLRSRHLDCSFYFFDFRDENGSTVAALLRSLAFQMAESSIEVRQAMCAMADNGVRLNHDDHYTLWTKVFIDRILKTQHTKPHYWVIDAIEECSERDIPTLVSMLSRLEHETSFRFFITGRPESQLGRLLDLKGTKFSEIVTGQEGSAKDIKILVKARLHQESKTEYYRSLITDILAKCNGSFLWASLVVARLDRVHSMEDKQAALKEIPPEMDIFYARIVASFTESPSLELIRCMLTWAICASKPLHIEELAEAVKLDIDRTLLASAKQLETMTGSLLFLDQQSYVRIAHQTVTVFLTQKRDGFWIDRKAAHTRITQICLTLLCGRDFAPPKTRRGGDATKGSAPSSLASYAAVNFLFHLMHGSSADDATLAKLNLFFRSNVLKWIERMITSGNLSTLELTTQRLKAYLGRRAKYQAPISEEAKTVRAWATDIHHIVAAFQAMLLTSPSSIHFIIPHLCPPKSSIYQLFAKPTERLRITGPLEEDWNDRIACYLFPQEASAISCGDRFLAVGLYNGDIKIYDMTALGTSDSTRTLIHGKKVRNLAFNRSSSLLASCSPRKLMLWDMGTSPGSNFPCLWSLDIEFTPSHMAFDPEESFIILANPQGSALVRYRILDGQREDPVLLHTLSDSDSSGGEMAAWTPAERIRLDPRHEFAALSYRNADVVIWDLSNLEPIGNFERRGLRDVYCAPQATDMIFNPVPELDLFAIAYKDGDLVTCNPWTLDQKYNCHLQSSLVALASTSDGRILAGATDDGVIYVFLFETLQLVYQIDRPDDQFRVVDIAFSADNLRFFDIRGQSCNVWEPYVLVSRDKSDDRSTQPYSEETILQEPPASHAYVLEWGRAITVIEQGPDANHLFVGRQDGTVDIFEQSTGGVVEKMQLHDTFTEISHIDWDSTTKCLLSVDSSGRCVVADLSSFGGGQLKTCILLRYRAPVAVQQAFLGPASRSLLISSGLGTKIIRVDDGIVTREIGPSITRWTRHVSNNAQWIALERDTLHLFEWLSPTELVELGKVAIQPPGPLLSVPSYQCMGGMGSSYMVWALLTPQTSHSGLMALDMSEVTSETKGVILQMLASRLLDVQSVLGCVKSSLYFLDTRGWVCSIRLKSLSNAKHYTRHFFIPPAWRTGTDAVIKILSKTTVAFGRGEQFIIFHGFLLFEEEIEL